MNSSAGQSLTDATFDLSIAEMLNLAPFIMGTSLMLTPKLTFVNSEVLELLLQYLFHYTFMYTIVGAGKYIVNQNGTGAFLPPAAFLILLTTPTRTWRIP